MKALPFFISLLVLHILIFATLSVIFPSGSLVVFEENSLVENLNAAYYVFAFIFMCLKFKDLKLENRTTLYIGLFLSAAFLFEEIAIYNFIFGSAVPKAMHDYNESLYGKLWHSYTPAHAILYIMSVFYIGEKCILALRKYLKVDTMIIFGLYCLLVAQVLDTIKPPIYFLYLTEEFLEMTCALAFLMYPLHALKIKIPLKK